MFENLPKKKDLRKRNEKYLYNDKIVIWDGKIIRCEHGKKKQDCKDCRGSQICMHGKFKRICKDCGGTALCEHGKFKRSCKDCGGAAFCKHGKFKNACKDCGGSQVCKHGKFKRICKDCGGAAFCEHGKLKRICKDCGGAAFCEHGKQKHRCKKCAGSSICKHGKFKPYCKKCGGSALCHSEWCETTGNKKYRGYCLFCFMNLFPDEKVARNYKTKEKSVVDFVKSNFPEFTWVCDKKIQDGCSKRRPDMLLNLGEYVIIIEIDENQHIDYDCSCENKRLMEISRDIGHRNCVFIRFNPDDYFNNNQNKITSCWGINKNGILSVKKTKQKEWEKRLNILKETIDYWTVNKTDKMVEVIQLFFDIS